MPSRRLPLTSGSAGLVPHMGRKPPAPLGPYLPPYCSHTTHSGSNERAVLPVTGRYLWYLVPLFVFHHPSLPNAGTVSPDGWACLTGGCSSPCPHYRYLNALYMCSNTLGHKQYI